MGSELAYLYRLLGHYSALGAPEYIVSKICSIDGRDSPVFCVRCCVLFVPNVNCKAKMDDKKFTVRCLSCSKEYVFGA
ncbi:hypothetical protein PAPHI01_0518 [Pancytospora philotis]|nr:hypothetical protein PAPHI01_0518 [Pancytospora philotis]